jgi:2-iminobutanoate/2-iminopropanoate deaminase
MTRTVIATGAAPRAIGPYSQAMRVGNLVFCSGQIALDPTSGEMVGAGDVAAETRQVLANLAAVLSAADSGLDRIVKATIYLADLADFATVNGIYGEAVGAVPPARATVQVARLPKDARVEIDAIAVAD